MPTKMFISYRLKPDADVDAFLQWSADVDQPFTNRLEGVHRFDVFLAEDATEDGKGPLFFEDIWVDSREHWDKVLSTPEGLEMVATWKAYADEESVQLVHGSRVI